MDKHYLRELLKRYRSGRITSEERQFLIDYYELFETQPDLMDTLSEAEKEGLKGDVQSAVWNRILKDKQSVAPVRFVERAWVRVAAAVIVLVFSVSMFYFFSRPGADTRSETASLVQPEENHVVFLPDGSKVILNGSSKLDYPSSFDGMPKREVFLTGEAYFDIVHNEKTPFVVRTGRIETVVLGTAFHVKAYPEDKTITVTVTRGKVKVMDEKTNKTFGVVTPNQQITYSKKDADAEKKTVDASGVLDWEKQDLICDNITVGEAASLLEERYGIHITIQNQAVRSKRFTTTFSKKEPLENILKSICVFNELSYEFRGSERDTVVLDKKN